VPGYGVPLYLIAAGPDGNNTEWTRRFFKKWADFSRAPISGWAPHYYCGTTGHALKFTDDQWYEMLAKANRMEKLITDQWAALGEFDREHKVKLVIDEWGCWHPAGTEINRAHLFEQMGCLRDALVAGLTLGTETTAFLALGTAAGLAYDVGVKDTRWSWAPFVVAFCALPPFVWSALDVWRAELGAIYLVALPQVLAAHVANVFPLTLGGTIAALTARPIL